ncbi:CoA transferase [Actinomadura meridiana]|uniref:CoA transferase n=1 Tax=Actinomadura meridiana TaxID=559626 RepID=A0ABP8BWH7_9ACTN
MIDEATAHAWTALGGRAHLAESVAYETAGPVLPARLPVRELARATVGACSLAAAELLALRRAEPMRPILVHEGAVATAFVSERHLRVDGRSHPLFAPLSGFWRASDGWVRTHANYPHHRARLLAALEIPDTGDDATLAETLREELATRPAESVQETVYEAGGLAVAVASAPSELRLPLVETRRTGDAEPRPLPASTLPAAGVRVLDLTRVIAGPVASRTLALLGADVLRVDSPRLPEDAMSHADTGMGKRSALLDLSRPDDRAVFDDLLGTADVVLTGYRPGALDRLGLSPDALSARRPDLIVARLSAWGWAGPSWGDGPGYLLAAAVLRALSDRHTDGGGRHLSFSLRGTASWLIRETRREPPGRVTPVPELRFRERGAAPRPGG